jgi:hypothetical protein
MYIFTDLERIYLTEMRAIATNSKGEEMLVGLTLEETEIYMKYANNLSHSNPPSNDKAYYLELHDKHELARLSVLSGENQLRIDNPKLH